MYEIFLRDAFRTLLLHLVHWSSKCFILCGLVVKFAEESEAEDASLRKIIWTMKNFAFLKSNFKIILKGSMLLPAVMLLIVTVLDLSCSCHGRRHGNAKRVEVRHDTSFRFYEHGIPSEFSDDEEEPSENEYDLKDYEYESLMRMTNQMDSVACRAPLFMGKSLDDASDEKFVLPAQYEGKNKTLQILDDMRRISGVWWALDNVYEAFYRTMYRELTWPGASFSNLTHGLDEHWKDYALDNIERLKNQLSCSDKVLENMCIEKIDSISLLINNYCTLNYRLKTMENGKAIKAGIKLMDSLDNNYSQMMFSWNAGVANPAISYLEKNKICPKEMLWDSEADLPEDLDFGKEFSVKHDKTDSLYSFKLLHDKIRELKRAENITKKNIIGINLIRFLMYDSEDYYSYEYRQLACMAILEYLLLNNTKEYGRYSLYVWDNYINLIQFTYFGVSRDSCIPNDYYNNFRQQILTQIFNHIASHPHDKIAIGEFFRFCWIPQIVRNGNNPFGNDCVWPADY